MGKAKDQTMNDLNQLERVLIPVKELKTTSVYYLKINKKVRHNRVIETNLIIIYLKNNKGFKTFKKININNI